MTPRAERATPIGHAGFARQTRRQMRRNEVANLPQERELAGVGLTMFFFMPFLVAGRKPARQPFLSLNPVGQQ